MESDASEKLVAQYLFLGGYTRAYEVRHRLRTCSASEAPVSSR